MKITLVYTLVCGKSDPNAPDPSYYRKYHERFFKTYRQFQPSVEHDLVVCFCGALPTDDDIALIEELPHRREFYLGSGWDIGAYQHASMGLSCDLAMFMAAPVYFCRQHWLEPFVVAVDRFGKGLYGPQASYENYPHIRTGCFACSPEILNAYPHTIDSRDKCMHFESGGGNPEWNFTTWCFNQVLPTKMITRFGFYDPTDWRTPDNIFRKGDQSSLLIRDRHNDIYDNASDEARRELSLRADGK